MDLQGQPIPPGHRSTKVTSDPERYEQPIQEPSGPVTKDSLAAESATKGGAFAQNRGAQPMGVSGQNSTVTNTDTSNARKIEPGSEQQSQQQSQPKNTDKIHPHQHQPRHPVGQQQKHQQAGAPASGSGYQGGVAPSYVHDVLDHLGNTKPKGTNLTEGDIPDDAPNASYTTDIGSENDPGRLAQGGFQLRSAESGPAGTPAGRQKGVDNQQPFQALQSDQRA